ncbi:MAG: DUF2225 domain-containing protein [Oscillospiraceae bacterium]|nr:DUF2225 domain-containing protein [Oscillospiraceae bacterium]
MVDISWLVEHGPCKKFNAGDTIACPGGTSGADKSMYILLVGHVDVYRNSAAGGMQKFSTLISGDVFGGREYFTNADDYKYVAGANSVAYVLNEDSFNDLSWSRPDVLLEILRAAYLPMRKASAKPVASPQVAAAQATTAQATTAGTQQSPEPPAAKVAPKKTVAAQTVSQQPAEAATAEQAPAPAQPKEATTPKSSADAQPKASSADGSSLAPTIAEIANPSGIFPEGHRNYTDYTVEMNMQLVFPKDYVCPFCNKTFNDFRVFRSKLYESQAMRYDLRKFYKEFKSEWYDVIVCRSCLFSTFHNYFTDPKPIKKVNIESKLTSVRADILLDFEAERDINFVLTSHYLAILCAEGYPGMDKQIRGKLWGNLSWLYEDLGDSQMEKFAAEKAAELYELIYAETRLTPVQEQITCLSIAGMQHRAGIDNNLRRYLFNAKTHQMGDKQYSKIAEDFMYELKLEDE